MSMSWQKAQGVDKGEVGELKMKDRELLRTVSQQTETSAGKMIRDRHQHYHSDEYKTAAISTIDIHR
ncbi:hypothetical protein E4U15_000137, partial [Claviceps sp. LM218 group G6]